MQIVVEFEQAEEINRERAIWVKRLSRLVGKNWMKNGCHLTFIQADKKLKPNPQECADD